MTYNPEQHQRHSIRLDGYDYAQAGAYFVTICTAQRTGLFGEVVDGKMILNAFGQVVRAEWERLPGHFPNIRLDAFGVMPNHVHGVIFIIDQFVGATRQPAVGATRHLQEQISASEDGSPLRVMANDCPGELREQKSVDGVGATRSLPEQKSAGEVGATRHLPDMRPNCQEALPDQTSAGEVESPLRVRPNGPRPGSLGAIIGQFK